MLFTYILYTQIQFIYIILLTNVEKSNSDYETSFTISVTFQTSNTKTALGFHLHFFLFSNLLLDKQITYIIILITHSLHYA